MLAAEKVILNWDRFWREAGSSSFQKVVLSSKASLFQPYSSTLYLEEHNIIGGKWSSRQLGDMQYLPLYIAFFLSVMAITFSIRAHNSTYFVMLERPIRVSPYFKSIRHVGFTNWNLCALEQHALDKIIEQLGEGYDGEDTAPVMIDLHSHVVPTTDLQTNTTTYVQTTYHHHFTPHAIETSTSWFEAPEHDDILVNVTYPYSDDDELLASFPAEYWSCHTLRFDSRSIVNDRLWILARIFFTFGTVIGFAAAILLTFLLLLRAKGVDERRIRQDDSLERRSSQLELAMPSSEKRKKKSITSIETEMHMLDDINTAGCRQISVCFLIAYLLQCLSLQLFLNGNVCVSQRCSLSSGARSLITSCVLFVICALLLTVTLEKGKKNQKKLRQLRRTSRKRKQQAEGDEFCENSDDGVLDTTANSDNGISNSVQKEDMA